MTNTATITAADYDDLRASPVFDDDGPCVGFRIQGPRACAPDGASIGILRPRPVLDRQVSFDLRPLGWYWFKAGPDELVYKLAPEPGDFLVQIAKDIDDEELATYTPLPWGYGVSRVDSLKYLARRRMAYPAAETAILHARVLYHLQCALRELEELGEAWDKDE